MFAAGKSVFACAFLALVAQTAAHAIPNPALGVQGTPARSDVQRPSTAKPCGNIDPATALDTSTAVAAAADGTVSMAVTNFNAGADGSTSVLVQVDATGLGTSFVAATVTKNGNANPTKVETDPITFQLPAGTKCTGGKTGNLCLISVKTTAGFGACSVVSQGAAAGTAAAASTAAAGTASTAATGTTGTAATGTTKKGKGKGKAAKAAAAKAAKAAKAAAAVAGAAPAAAAVNKKVGTRAARALRLELAELERRAFHAPAALD